jgi:hypothetical protein
MLVFCSQQNDQPNNGCIFFDAVLLYIISGHQIKCRSRLISSRIRHVAITNCMKLKRMRLEWPPLA